MKGTSPLDNDEIRKSGTVPMHRQTDDDILKDAFIAAGLDGKLATHSLRKSFMQRLYDSSGDIYLVKELLGIATSRPLRSIWGSTMSMPRQRWNRLR